MSYLSPIEIISGEVQTKLEGDVLKVIQNYDIKVDKDELLKALAYDRDQYRKGWEDGYVQANADIVRCKDCKWIDLCKGPEFYEYKGANGFCSYGKRKDEVEE